jgi:hypothetical protein
MTTHVDSPLKWIGGKHASARRILAAFPPAHTYGTYHEPCGGAAHVLMLKPTWGHREIYNDLNDDLCNFWRMVQDHADELVERLQALPYSRKLYYYQVGVHTHARKRFDHERLAALLNAARGYVALSYYPHLDLERWYPPDRWRRIRWQVQKVSAIHGETPSAVQTTTELLLCNYPASAASLWDLSAQGREGSA